MQRMTGAAVVLMAAIVLLSMRAYAQDYPRTSAELRVSERAPTAGATITIDGGGCSPGAGVTVATEGGSILETSAADAAGDFATEVAIPAAAHGGELQIEATCARLGGGTHVLAGALSLHPAEVSGALTASTGEPAPGEAITVSGDGCAPKATVTLATSANTVFQTATADAEGAFVKSVTVPSGTASGPLTINASCAVAGTDDEGGSTQVLAVTVTVAAEPAVLAFSSRSVGSTAIIGIALGLAGSTVFLIGRRIRNA